MTRLSPGLSALAACPEPPQSVPDKDSLFERSALVLEIKDSSAGCGLGRPLQTRSNRDEGRHRRRHRLVRQTGELTIASVATARPTLTPGTPRESKALTWFQLPSINSGLSALFAALTIPSIEHHRDNRPERHVVRKLRHQR
jgi:hypothetical protein